MTVMRKVSSAVREVMQRALRAVNRSGDMV